MLVRGAQVLKANRIFINEQRGEASMKVLVTGGTGVIGEGAIPALLDAGHKVRLLTRGAETAAREWPSGVEPFAADVSDVKSLTGAADDCQAVIHITGIVNESPPRVTFESINVTGTKNMLREAARAGANRFIFISSLGADRGRSAYHQSKLRAEKLVKKFKGQWLILRPGGVYGPGDEVLSTFLKLIRTLPVIPVIDSGEQRFQPLWFEDMGKAVARAIEVDLSGETLELAGREVITVNELLDRLSHITGRTPARLPLPSFAANLGAKLFEGNQLADKIKELTGLYVPADEAKLTMLLEENFIREPERNALTEVFKIEPTPLDEGLKALADLLPEQSITEGVGPVERKRFYADVEKSRYNATELLEEFRARVLEIMPLEFSAEPGAATEIEKGATMTASIPLRGNIQVRVEELTARRITFVTLEGHPLAGIVQFKTSALKRGVRFMIEIHTRDASFFDSLTLSLGGSLMQNMNWQQVVERVMEMSGGRAPVGVQSGSQTLSEEEAERVEQMVEGLMKRYKKSVRATDTSDAVKTRADDSKSKSTVRPKAAQRYGRKPSNAGTKKRDASTEATAAVSGAIDTVSEAASSLVKSLSSAASNLTQGARRAGRKRTKR
jgi:uncharacterized protein YbjT (DUF2867 family)